MLQRIAFSCYVIGYLSVLAYYTKKLLKISSILLKRDYVCTGFYMLTSSFWISVNKNQEEETQLITSIKMSASNLSAVRKERAHKEKCGVFVLSDTPKTVF